MLVYFEPAAMCNLRHDLVLAPLPARKQLWEAQDALTWQREIHTKPPTAETFGLARNGKQTLLESQICRLAGRLPAGL